MQGSVWHRKPGLQTQESLEKDTIRWPCVSIFNILNTCSFGDSISHDNCQVHRSRKTPDVLFAPLPSPHHGAAFRRERWRTEIKLVISFPQLVLRLKDSLAGESGAFVQEKMLPCVCLLHPTAPLRASVCLTPACAGSDVPDTFHVFKHSAVLINWLLFQEPTSNSLVIYPGEAGTTGLRRQEAAPPPPLLVPLSWGQKHPINPRLSFNRNNVIGELPRPSGLPLSPDSEGGGGGACQLSLINR